LEEYLRTRKKSDMFAVELCNGLRDYFDLMLGAQLLYNYERDQYSEIVKVCEETDPKKLMSDCYGFAHLLRLFTKLGVSLSYTDLDVEAVELLQSCSGELLGYLSRNREDYFSVEDYTAADPEYQRQVAP